MESLLSNHQPQFEIAKRNDLYYGKFRHSARFFLKEASALRELDYDKIEKTLAYRSSWSSNRVSNSDRQGVHQACNGLLALPNPFKIMVSLNWLYFYTNDVADIDYLCANTSMQKLGDTTEVVITHPKDTIGLKNPRHAFRTYIRSHRPTDYQLNSLREFVKHNKKYIKVSPGLKDFLNPKKTRYWMMDYHYIDHNDMKMVTALALMNPKLIRKTLPIVQVNN